MENKVVLARNRNGRRRHYYADFPHYRRAFYPMEINDKIVVG
jgi:hypothetical protein